MKTHKLKNFLIIFCLLLNLVIINSNYLVLAASGQWIYDASVGKWWYKYSNGSYPSNQWLAIDGYTYHFDSAGWMDTGWLKSGSYWYYLDTSGMNRPYGARTDNDWLFLGTESYHFDVSGRMQTGWNRVFYSGYQIANQNIWHYFDSNGIWQTDSDVKGCTHAQNTFDDDVFRQVNNIKYFIAGTDPNVTNAITGFNTWYNRSSLNISRVFNIEQANIEVSTKNNVDPGVYAFVTMYEEDNFTYPLNPSLSDWLTASITFNINIVPIARVMPHEIGHALGLTHCYGIKDTIMCEENPNLNITYPTSRDLNIITHIYAGGEE